MLSQTAKDWLRSRSHPLHVSFDTQAGYKRVAPVEGVIPLALDRRICSGSEEFRGAGLAGPMGENKERAHYGFYVFFPSSEAGKLRVSTLHLCLPGHQDIVEIPIYNASDNHQFEREALEGTLRSLKNGNAPKMRDGKRIDGCLPKLTAREQALFCLAVADAYGYLGDVRAISKYTSIRDAFEEKAMALLAKDLNIEAPPVPVIEAPAARKMVAMMQEQPPRPASTYFQM